ncbi:MAG: hypothetical protein M0Z88_08410 [Actinomycetota bacterium]|nr:hypothetical protein [Actinomycetota bacterium]
MSNLAVNTLTFALDGLGMSQQAIANNISNRDTPGFTATNVDFATSLRQALASGSPGATASVSVSASTDPANSSGNNVSLSSQLVGLENATMSYQADISLIEQQFKLLSGSMGGPF